MRALVIALLLVTIISCTTPSPQERGIPTTPDAEDTGVSEEQRAAVDDNDTTQNESVEDETMSAREEFLNLTNKTPPQALTMRVHTSVTSEGETREEEAIEYVTPQRFHARVNRTIEGEPFTTLIFFLEGSYYECIEQEGWRCFSFPNERAQNPSRAAQTPTIERVIERAGTRVVAGIEAQCFQARANIEDGLLEETFCYDDEGVALYEERVAPGYALERAVSSLTRSVDESVFELPASPQPLEAQEE